MSNGCVVAYKPPWFVVCTLYAAVHGQVYLIPHAENHIHFNGFGVGKEDKINVMILTR